MLFETGLARFTHRRSEGALGLLTPNGEDHPLQPTASLELSANLWLPMAADGDTDFNILAPAPKDAKSVLGLLLRNSALRVAADATNEFAGLGAGLPAGQVARETMNLPIANLQAAAGIAIPVLSGFAAEASVVTPQSQAAAAGKDASGAHWLAAERRVGANCVSL